MSKVAQINKTEIVEFNEFDAQLAEFKGRYDGVVYDLTIPEDEKQARSDRLTIGKVISKLDSKHKDLKAPLKAQTDLIDGERKRIKDDLLGVQDKIKSQIKQHEDAIQEHAEMLQGKVDFISNLCLPTEYTQESGEVAELLEQAKLIVVDDSYEHRKADAALAQIDTIKTLELRLTIRVKNETEQAELEKLRAESEAREQKDREDAIRKEAEAKAKDDAEREAKAEAEKVKADAAKADQASKDAIAAAERKTEEAEMERERVEKDATAKAEQAATDERNRIEEESRIKAEKDAAELAKIEAKKSKQAHRKKIHTAIKKDMVLIGVNTDSAIEIIEAIRDGKIRRLSIDY